MSWDFSTDDDFQPLLDWADSFVREEIEPLDVLWPYPANYQPLVGDRRRVVLPLKQQVRDQGLWACHLGPELGGQGYGQVKLSLLNEILGRSTWAPVIFGAQAPDSGNAEILARFGTPDQRRRYLEPLLEGEVFSCYSMTEPQGGSDPSVFSTTARRDGDEWVIDGVKFFTSNARWADFFIVLAYTDRAAGPHRGMSMFLVPAGTPGLRIVRNSGLSGDPPQDASHALVHYDGVRVPADALLGPEGGAFAVAQTRLGGGRVHHAMRTVGLARRAFDMLCERALSRSTRGSRLADMGTVQQAIADSYAQLQQFRLFVLYVAWQIDRLQDYAKVRRDISAIKATMPGVLRDVVQRSMHIHGALGLSDELPLGRMWMQAPVLAMVDGPTEVHQAVVARDVLKQYRPAEGLWPTEHLPSRLAAAQHKIATQLQAGVDDR